MLLLVVVCAYIGDLLLLACVCVRLCVYRLVSTFVDGVMVLSGKMFTTAQLFTIHRIDVRGGCVCVHVAVNVFIV